jgi:PAS domain S-box-containing protein
VLAGAAKQAGGGIEAENLAVLYRLTDGLYRANTYKEIFDAALDAITASLGSRASILLFDKAGVMRFSAWRGLSDAYRKELEGHSPWTPSDVSPDPICVRDIEGTNEPEHVKRVINAEGIRGLAFIPLLSRRRVIGKFMTYYPEPHDFLPVEVNLAVTIARQLGFSIERQRAGEELRESEERFRLLSEDAPVMLWMSDSDGRCLHLNRQLRAFWGVENENLAEFDWQSTMHPDDREAIGRAMLGAIESRRSVTVEGRYQNAEGSYRLLSTNAQPRVSAAGAFLGMIGVNVDITERREAETALRESEERLRVALAAGRMGTWRYDLRTGAQWWDARQYELFGIAPTVAPSRDLFLSIVHPEDRGKVGFDPQSLPPQGSFLDSEFRILRPDGAVRWITAHSVARQDADGRAEMIGVNFDITQQKDFEEDLRLLLAELNHRVKNTLAVVQAIAHQTFRNGNASEAAQRAFEGRLIALSTAHDLLTQSNWESASIRDIATDTFVSQGADGRRLSLDGPEIHLAPKQALALALAFHELCTNAVKYGALSNEAGGIAIRWGINPGRTLHIEWTEAKGPPVLKPERRGFGSRLIEHSLVRDLDARVALEFHPSGVRCTIDARLPATEQ